MRRFQKIGALLAAVLLLCAVFPAVKAYASPVITGKDGWYFIDSDSTIPDYTGTDLFTQEQLDILLMRFLTVRDTLEQMGVEFVVFLVPNKEHIYAEYMPDSYGEPAAYTRIDQVYDCLKDYVRVIYPEEELLSAKETLPYDIYYRTDPHWNNIGNYLMMKLLMEELGYEMPDLSDLTVTAYPTADLDCSQMLGVSLPDVEYTVTGYEGLTPSEHRVLLVGDSFGYALSLCMEPIVSDILMVHRDIYDPVLLIGSQPTVLVYEILERFMDSIFRFSPL